MVSCHIKFKNNSGLYAAKLLLYMSDCIMWFKKISSVLSVFLPVQKSCMSQMFPIERWSTWNSAGNQRHYTSQNTKCRKSPSTSNALWLSCLACSWLNCRILKMWHCIIGDPVSWEQSAGLGHVEDTAKKVSWFSSHSHRINEYPLKENLLLWSISSASLTGVQDWALPRGCGGYASLASWWLGCGYHLDDPTCLLHCLIKTSGDTYLRTSGQHDVQKPPGSKNLKSVELRKTRNILIQMLCLTYSIWFSLT